MDSTICIACNLNQIEISSIFCKSCTDQFAKRMKKHYEQSTIADDMIFNNNKDSIYIGSRVKCKDTGGIGTVVFIALQDSPFRIKWDISKGIDNIDWFKGEQLERI